jgi:hypothetical protein
MTSHPVRDKLLALLPILALAIVVAAAIVLTQAPPSLRPL